MDLILNVENLLTKLLLVNNICGECGAMVSMGDCDPLDSGSNPDIHPKNSSRRPIG